VLEIVPPGTHFDFIGRRRTAFVVSALLIAASLAAVALEGVRFGIDFAGGTEVAVRFEPGVASDEGALRELATACGVLDPAVVRYGEGESHEFLIRFNRIAEGAEGGSATCPVSDEGRAKLLAVAEATGAKEETEGSGAAVDFLMLAMRERIGALELLSVDYVGPRVGEELRRDGALAMGIAMLCILVYVTFRFSSRFAPGAVAALVHDVLITAGIFVLFQLEFDLSVLAALLAIVGYSLNDTIIVYDRIRENMERRTKLDLADVLNESVNETLSRTLLTSLTTLGAVICLLLLGGEVIFPFALAMAVGIVVGTYSSIFVAAPMLLVLEQRFGASPSTGSKGGAGKKRTGGSRAA
jgi:preprotein translocase subunit SecF